MTNTIGIVKPKQKNYQPNSSPFTSQLETYQETTQFTLAQSLLITSILLVYAGVAYAVAKQLIK
jgi:hypothetical protein